MGRSLTDLRRAFFGNTDEEYAELQAAADAGITLTDLLDGSAFSDAYSKPLWVPTNSFSSVSGAPSLSNRNRLPAWSLDSASIEGLGASVLVGAELPADWATMNVLLYWCNVAASSGNVVWRFDQTTSADGGAIAVPTVGSNVVAAAPATADVLEVTTVASDIVVPSDASLFTLALWRIANDAADTLANDAAVFGVRLVKAS